MRNFIALALTGLLVASSGQVWAQNLLLNGTFEPASAGIPGWSLAEFYTGQSGDVDSAVVNVTTTGQSGDRHLFLQAYNSGSGTETSPFVAPVNAELSQVVGGVTAGNTYNFSGYSRFEGNFSGGVDTLADDPDADTPFEGGPSPTTMALIVEFLNSTGNPVGSPFSLDVKTDRAAVICSEDIFCSDPSTAFLNDNLYYQHNLEVTAPTGATQARVTAAANDMVWNDDPGQAAFYDTFSFKDNSATQTELLLNAELDDEPPTALDGWTVAQNDPGNPTNEEVVRAGPEFAFANHTPGGTAGVWLSSFFGEPLTPVDGSVSQTVAGIAGETYSFTGWSRRQANFSAAALPMELAFLDSVGEVLGTPIELDVIGSPKDDEWYQHELMGTAPAGTAQVRVSAGMVDGVNSTGAQSAFYDDFVLELLGGDPSDLNGDGFVDGLDLGILLGNFNQNAAPGGGELNGTDPVDGLDLGILLGAWNPPGLSAASVPEPMSGLMLLSGVALAAMSRRRG